ncbi:MAG: hypothetical protein J2P28_01475 [Actinobacteria bacterium]|nr:hypothetical protein [Actinomycetota bacterium]MBO0834173.1 hypothetical protein [Actinomycetota bacterium]
MCLHGASPLPRTARLRLCHLVVTVPVPPGHCKHRATRTHRRRTRDRARRAVRLSSKLSTSALLV